MHKENSVTFKGIFGFNLLATFFAMVTLMFLAIIILQPAHAQGGAAMGGVSQQGDQWSYRLAPYLWLPMMSGDVGIKNIRTDVDTSISDLVDNLDGGALIAFEANYKRWISITDFNWLGLEDSEATPRGILFSSSKAEIDQIGWTQLFGYQVTEQTSLPLDLLAGFRLISIDSDLTIQGAELQSQKFSMDESWIDPVIGARTLIELSEPVYLRLYGDIGGFGAASSLTWQALVAIDYKVSSTIDMALGYRALGYDYGTSEFTYDVIAHGPFLGAGFRF